MAEVKSQIEDYLSLMKMKYTWDEKAGAFQLLFTERKDARPVSPSDMEQKDTFRYVVTVKPFGKWVQIRADVYPLEMIPQEKLAQVLMDLLTANLKYPEVCFDLDQERGIIGTSQEMMTQGLNFDGFREEFFAVPWAVKRFWAEIAPKHGLS
ncbi:MAG: hypothetical protein HXY34_05375 [Candidatus Thorarchaeota archaeon]|nr:hypothetical protein [Candidatus Thorarchaeota archaeon]